MRSTRRFVVVSGLPGCGKSTVGRRIAPLLELALFDKDDFLEQRFEAEPKIDSDLRFRLSRQADDDLRAAAESSRGAVLVSFWRREELSTTSGTPTRWLRALPNVIEVYCTCPPAIAAERFLARTRHQGHGDTTRNRDDLARQFKSYAALGPLRIGRLLHVDTVQPDNLDALIAELSNR